MDSNLTADDFDWLRKLKGAADAKRNPPPIPIDIAAKLRTFGLGKPNSFGACTITKAVTHCWTKTCAMPKIASSPVWAAVPLLVGYLATVREGWEDEDALVH